MRVLAGSVLVISAVIFFQFYLAVLNPYFAHAFTGQGDGSANNPYRITTCAELQQISSHVTSAFILMNDIDCSASKDWNAGKGFSPIDIFSGGFDGRNFTVTGLYMNRPMEWQAGLFTRIGEGGVVKNITLASNGNEGDGASITGRGAVGAVAGEVFPGAHVINVHTNLRVRVSPDTGEQAHAGGLTGVDRGSISKSSSSGRVELDQSGTSNKWVNLGGLVGMADGDDVEVELHDNYSTAQVTTGNEPDNLFSQESTSTCGGLIGALFATGSLDFQRNYTAGSIVCNQNRIVAGGFIGSIGNNSIPVLNNNFAATAVTAPNAIEIGGFAGTAGSPSVTLAANFVDVQATQQSDCNLYKHDCTLINVEGGEPDYFINPDNQPFPNWDQQSTWDIPGSGGGLPTHKSFTVMSSAPSGLEATRDGDAYNLTWNAVVDDEGRGQDIDDYIVEYRTNPINDSGVGTWTTYDDGISTNASAVINGLDIPGRYDFRVVAHSSAGRGVSSGNLTFATGMPESAPVFSSTESTSKSISAQWSDIPTATAYKLQYKTGGGDWQEPTAVLYTGTSAFIYGLAPQTTYTLRVTATNSYGQGPWSTEAVIATTSQQNHDISSCAQLQDMQNDLEGVYKLTKDLDCSETAGWNQGKGFIPIGQFPASFYGKFDGQGHTISNLFINASFAESDTDSLWVWGAGLFGDAFDAEIKNVTLSGAAVTATYEYASDVDENGNGVPDFDPVSQIPQNPTNLSSGSLYGVFNDAANSVSAFGVVGVGGVVGSIGGSGTYTNLHVTNSAINGPVAGGVIGLTWPEEGFVRSILGADFSSQAGKLIMDNLSSDGAVNGFIAGGLVGGLTSPGAMPSVDGTGTATITGSTSSASVSGQAAGGLVGFALSLTAMQPTFSSIQLNQIGISEAANIALSESNISIQNSSATGQVSTCNAATGLRLGALGGLIGFGVGVRLQNTAASGDVTVCNSSDILQTNGGAMGGLAGSLFLSSVKDSQATGAVKVINNFPANQSPNANFFVGVTGGLVGLMVSSGDASGQPIIKNSKATGNTSLEGIHGMANLSGGLVGMLLGSGTVQDSYATGSVISQTKTNSFVSITSSGGLVGFAAGMDVPYFVGIFTQDPVAPTYGLVIDNSYATGAVRAQAGAGPAVNSAGGLAGWLLGKVRVTRSYATGNISNNFPEKVTVKAKLESSAEEFKSRSTRISNAGGLVGTAVGLDSNKIINSVFHIADSTEAGGVSIESSYASGSVQGNISGGLVGAGEFALKINKAYATGDVQGTGAAGGLVGEAGTVSGLLGGLVSSSFLLEPAFLNSFVPGTISNFNPATNPTYKNAAKYGLDVMGRISITNTYATGKVTGLPVEFSASYGAQDGAITTKPSSTATFAGGLIGLHVGLSATVKDSYAAGEVVIAATPTLPAERPVAPNFKPPNLPTFAGGLFGATVLFPLPTNWAALDELLAGGPVTSDTLKDIYQVPSKYENLFSASKLSIPPNTVTGGLVGSVISPLSIVTGDILPDDTMYTVKNSYYDNSRITYTACSGPASVKSVLQGILDTSDFPDEQGNNTIPANVSDEHLDQLSQYYAEPVVKPATCTPVNQNNSQPNYFKNNKANAPLDTWNFSNLWVTRKDDYPKFVAGVDTEIPNDGGNDTPTTPVTPSKGGPTIPRRAAPPAPSNTTQVVAKLADPLGRKSLEGSQVKGAWIQAIPIFVARSLPSLIILLLLLLAVRYSYEALRQYRQLKKYHDSLLRVTAAKTALNDFLAITTHHLNTPVAIMNGAVELLQSLKKVPATRITILQAKLKAFSDAVSKLATDNEVSVRKSVNSEKIIHRKLPNPLKDKAVWGPIAIAFGLLATVNVLCMSFNLLSRSPVRIAIEFCLLALAGALVAFSHHYQKALEQNKQLAKQELALESGLYKQREQFIPEASAIIADHYESLQVASASLKGQTYAKLFFNGLTMLGGVNAALQNLQKFSRFVVDPPLFDVSHYVQKAIAEVQPKAEAKTITIDSKVSAGLATRIHPAEITQLVDSILDNALKFSKNGGKITVVLQRHFGRLQLTVQDDGTGISEAKLATLMKPFARGTDTMEFNYEGLGLSLYANTLIVNKLGGDIGISSRYGSGTTVTVSLPFLHEAAQAAPVLIMPEQSAPTL